MGVWGTQCLTNDVLVLNFQCFNWSARLAEFDGDRKAIIVHYSFCMFCYITGHTDLQLLFVSLFC